MTLVFRMLAARGADIYFSSLYAVVLACDSWARVDRMDMVDAFAYCVTLDDLFTHGYDEVECSGGCRM